MKRRDWKIIIIIGSIILAFWLGMRFERFMGSPSEIGKPRYNREEIYFPKLSESIYLKSKTWGISGNHRITVISTNPDYEFYADSTQEYLFYGFSDLIYKKSNDSLYVYNTHTPQIPTNFNSQVKIKNIKLGGADWRKMSSDIENSLRKFD